MKNFLFSCNVRNLNKMFFYLSDSGLILDLNTVLWCWRSKLFALKSSWFLYWGKESTLVLIPIHEWDLSFFMTLQYVASISGDLLSQTYDPYYPAFSPEKLWIRIFFTQCGCGKDFEWSVKYYSTISWVSTDIHPEK